MIVITGASDGLGLELAKLYRDAGKHVVNVSRHLSEVADTNLLHDLSTGDGIDAASREILAIDEPLESVINCAGVYSKQPLGKITEDEIKRVMATNVKASLLLISNLTGRIRQDGTDIVNVASTIGFKGALDEALYGASKWALRGFSANLQQELKDTPCRVISFCPGGMQTDLFEKALDHGSAPDVSKWMHPADVARCLKQILDLPKNMEVSEIIINKKVSKS